MSLFLGALLAYLFYPVYNKIQKKFKRKSIPATILCVVVLLMILIPGLYFIQSLISESYILYITVKQKLSVGLFNQCTAQMCNYFKEFIGSPNVAYYIQEATRGLTDWIIKKSSQLLVSLPIITLNLFVVIFTMFYFLRDGKYLVKKMNYYFSIRKKKYVLILSRLKEIISGIVYGYLLVAFMQGALGALGFFIFGISSPIFWGLLMAFLALIPYLGTGVVWLPASLFLFLEGLFQDSNMLMFKGIALFVYCLIFVASSDNFVRPHLMSGKAKIHPGIMLLGIIGGLYFFGIFGVIIGPLVLSLTTVIIENYINNQKSVDNKKN